MPMYDRRCVKCGYELIDRLEPVTEPAFVPCDICGAPTQRVWLAGQKASSVISDECDVTVTNGICNLDGTPRRYTSKSEMAAEARRRGLVNHVVHQPGRGTDKSKHTSRWV